MYARVAVARPLPELTYAIPPHAEVRVGHVVLVPLGPTGETGYVVDLCAEPGIDPARVKPISRVIDPLPAFDERQLEFFRWIADYYLVSLGRVIAAAIPAQMKARVVRVIEPTEDGAAALAAQTAGEPLATLIREVIARPGLTRRGLAQRLRHELDGDGVERAVAAAARRGWVRAADREIAEAKGTIRTVALVVAADEALARVPRQASRMRAIAAELAAAPADLPDLAARHGTAARDAVDRLVALGIAEIRTRELRDPLAQTPALGPSEAPPLNRDQEDALAALASSAGGTWLLHGVTGSGKTEVFLGAARATLDRGRQVVVLVPEIGLTPQLVGRFRARFGDAVAVLHSGLTGGERLSQWRRIRAGEASVAVGARSALFAPFRDLGLIVVDEEHDESYKQDDGVPYNARDLAVVLGKMRGCPVVLASATPSLESWSNAQQNRYQLLSLPVRATPRPVPVVEVVDLSALPVPKGAKAPLLAPEVEQALRETFDNGGQAIVLYNRRGFATLVECAACGAAYECPSCGLAMTLHRAAWRLVCHYCAYTVPYSEKCPVCGAPELREEGRGTERVEEQLQALFPDIPQARMDADTTAARGALHHLLEGFRAGATRLLVGTQIVAKGHDFPGVHTAVVISADRGIRMPDFRAAERTFALLVQLAGRAGRGDVPGRVFVQTWKPDHYVIRHLDSVEKFLAAELRLRYQLRYPPHTRLCLVRVEGTDRKTASNAAGELSRDLRAEARGHDGVAVLGPAPAALPRLVGRWRFQLVLRGAKFAAFRAFLAAVRPRLEAASRKGVRVEWDVDPRNLL